MNAEGDNRGRREQVAGYRRLRRRRGTADQVGLDGGAPERLRNHLGPCRRPVAVRRRPDLPAAGGGAVVHSVDARVSDAVGFDLDMTLIDSRPGIRAAYRALTEKTGVHVDADLAVTRLGPPLRAELGHWFPPEDLEAAVTTYRGLYPDYAITPTVPTPGALEALDAVRRMGLRVVVVTSKLGRLAELHLEHLGMVVDEL